MGNWLYVILVHVCCAYCLQLYELGSGKMLCTFLFDCGLTKVTMDACMSRLFVGGNTGDIWQVNLFLQVLISYILLFWIDILAILSVYRDGQLAGFAYKCISCDIFALL